jgi:hypothetical protein
MIGGHEDRHWSRRQGSNLRPELIIPTIGLILPTIGLILKPSPAPHRRGRQVGLAALALLGLVTGLGCQGSFDPPPLVNPHDPANSDLPPVPAVTATGAGCSGGVPEVRVTWSVTSDPSITGFQVYRSSQADIDPGFLVASTGAAVREFVDGSLPGTSPLLEDVPYWYRVRVLGPDGLMGFRSAPDSALTRDCR